MNLIREKTQIETDKENLELSITSVVLALAATAQALNNAWDVVWKLPDNRLIALMQDLLITGKLQNVLTVHYTAAVGINNLLDSVEYDGLRCFDFAGRQFEIIDGVVTLIYPPEPEIVEDVVTPPEPEPEIVE